MSIGHIIQVFPCFIIFPSDPLGTEHFFFQKLVHSLFQSHLSPLWLKIGCFECGVLTACHINQSTQDQIAY